MEGALAAFMAFSKSEPTSTSTKTKRQKKKRQREEEANPRPVKQKIEHPFPTEPEDHAETDDKAYQDVQLVLDALAKALNKPRSELRIYDPYYCTGRVARVLDEMGFSNCYNKNEDFYKVAEEEEVPEHDVLLTNPPYSHDHMERILAFCKRRNDGRPFMLLMPSWVYSKPYYKRVLGDLEKEMAYVCPSKRYCYWAPKELARGRMESKAGEGDQGAAAGGGGEHKKKRTHTKGGAERTSPWTSFWYCHFGSSSKAVRKSWKKALTKISKAAAKECAYMTREPPATD